MFDHSIYLDNNATTPIDPRVAEHVADLMQRPLGNPSSFHAFGREAKELLSEARRKIAGAFQVKPQQVLFTSSGTESLNHVIRMVCSTSPNGHIVTSTTEHACVYQTIKEITDSKNSKWKATFLNSGEFGAISPSDLEAAILPETKLIALMAANNETGVLSDVEAYAAIADAHGIPLLVDAVSLIGKESFHLPRGVSALCFSGHKFHAPVGTGVTILQRPLHKLNAYITGGSQENGRRASTENVINISATALALELALEALPKSHERMLRLRDQLYDGLLEQVGGIQINGKGPRLCNTLNLSFNGIDGETLLINLDRAGLAASHGSACTTGALEPSRILLGMGYSYEKAGASIRFSLSRLTTPEEIERAIQIIARVA